MHSPQLVFLDEPTPGLDPQSRANLWEHVRSLRDDFGVTIVLTTHYLDEADALADRILVIDHGTIVADDTADDLKAGVSGDVISLQVEGDLVVAQQVAAAAIECRANVVEATARPHRRATATPPCRRSARRSTRAGCRWRRCRCTARRSTTCS